MKHTVRRRGDKEYTYLSRVEAVHVDGKNTQRELLRLGEVGEVERTGDGLLRIDKGAIANEARFDGKFLLRTSDETLSPTDLALAYKQLY